MTIKGTFFILFTFLTIALFAVDSAKVNSAFEQNEKDRYENILTKSREFGKINLYSQELELLYEAVDVAKQNVWEKEYISSTIRLAELKRKTGDHRSGIELLKSLEVGEEYPELLIRKYGRLAALYNENKNVPVPARVDSVNHYLNLAIPIAEQYNIRSQLASLKNEKACILMDVKKTDLKEILSLFNESAELFKSIGDTHNYVIVLNHSMQCNFYLKRFDAVDSIKEDILEITKDKNWYQTKADFYGLVSKIEGSRMDSINFFRYQGLSKAFTIKFMEQAFQNKMASIRVVQETEKYQQESAAKSWQLEQEENRSKLMIGFISVLLLLFIGIGFLFFREKRLKRVLDITNNQLRSANDKYQTLLVESNHRIKNNLQMIISMFDYSAQVEIDNPALAFERMSGKIQTVSALHKHLYLETHNENLNLKFYFTEILDLYKRLSKEHIEVNSKIFKKLEIPSERLVYFGLVFNEMIANTIEHHTNDQISINISVQPENDHYLFYYADGSKFDDQKSSGTGSLLIEELINRVEGFNVTKDNTKGVYQFEFYG